MKKIFFLFMLIAASASAQQANTELQGLIAQALQYNPKIKELEQVQVIDETNLEIAKGYRYPTVSADASYTYIDPVTKVTFPFNGVDQAFQFQPNHNYDAALKATYALLDWGKSKSHIDKVKEEMAQGGDNLKRAQGQLAAQVATIYYGIIYLQKAIEVEDSALTYLGVNYKTTEDRYKNGDALQLDVINIQALIDNENNRKADLQNQLQKQVNLMEYATGVRMKPANAAFDFTASETNIDAALNKAISTNPEFSSLQHKINAAKADVKFARSNQYPLLAIHGSAGVKNGYLPELQVLKFNVVAGASVSLPLYSGMKAKNTVQLAMQGVKLNELGVTSLQAQYKKDISNAVADVTTSQEHLKFSQTQIEQSKQARQVTASRYRNGIATYVDVENAVVNYERAQLTYLQYSYQLCQANIELARLTGTKYW